MMAFNCLLLGIQKFKFKSSSVLDKTSCKIKITTPTIQYKKDLFTIHTIVRILIRVVTLLCIPLRKHEIKKK